MANTDGIVEGLNPKNAAQTLLLFYGRQPIYGNFTITPFKVDGRKFNCTEQYFQYHKAKFFNDEKSANQIMKATSPAKQKRLGRSVKEYNDARWIEVRCNVMEDGCTAKFLQNPQAKQALRATGDKILVECTPYDRIWGNGLRLTDRRALDPKMWRGLNLMGEVLMKVRKFLTDEDDK